MSSARAPRIDVVAAGLRPGDGVTYEVQQCCRALRSLGFSSDLYCDFQQSAPEAREYAYDFRELTRRPPPDAVLYGYASLSPCTSFLVDQKIPVIIRYLNITPEHYFTVWDPEIAQRLRLAREQLALLKDQVIGAICPSRYNAQELASVIPCRTFVVANFCRLLPRPSALPAPAPLRILFIGRLVPNKCQHELVQVASLLTSRFGCPTELVLAGWTDCSGYASLVRSLASSSSASVRFLGVFPDGVNVFDGTHFYLSLSEHEGFGMPLVEAMSAGVPVLAYAAAAVPEVVGQGGLLFEGKDLVAIAALVASLARDEKRWLRLREAGLARAREFRHEVLRAQLAEALRQLGFEVPAYEPIP